MDKQDLLFLSAWTNLRFRRFVHGNVTTTPSHEPSWFTATNHNSHNMAERRGSGTINNAGGSILDTASSAMAAGGTAASLEHHGTIAIRSAVAPAGEVTAAALAARARGGTRASGARADRSCTRASGESAGGSCAR